MILFYNNDTGEIFGTIDGRVHDEKALSCYIDNGSENIGKYIIGWIEKDGAKMEYNIDKFDTLKRFEDITAESPLDYRIIDGELIKK